MGLETVNEPILGHNPYLGLLVSEIASEIRKVDFQRAVALGEYRDHLDQNKGWLQEALYVEITWNRIQSERES